MELDPAGKVPFLEIISLSARLVNRTQRTKRAHWSVGECQTVTPCTTHRSPECEVPRREVFPPGHECGHGGSAAILDLIFYSI